MNGPIAQAVALTCHGSAALAGHAVKEFLRINSTCQFCESVRFVTRKRTLWLRTIENEVAATPEAWFEYLKTRGARGILLSRAPDNTLGRPDRVLAGLAGCGGAWRMHVCLPNGATETWLAKWEVRDRNPLGGAQHERPWLVTYVLVSKWASRPGRTQPTLAAAELEGALADVRAFSARQECDHFTRVFDNALETIRSGGASLHGYHRDLAPSGSLPVEAATLLDACQSAWVFGGMGSWNDMGFRGEDGAEYRRISERLFQVLCRAIACGANASCRGC